ncbi:DHA2 family efflux MFS transporter permease subunit [Nocardia sp. bgisy134]|uniref:DHA2 family efflux MFS transporter permease subunit n=1 Tax=unclassified Nocardia TaxID=2637762 RepID=UPI003D709D13
MTHLKEELREPVVDRPALPVSRRARITLAAVCLSTFMLLLDLTIVATALAELQSTFTATLGSLQWVVDAYTLPIAGMVLIAATVGDRIGRKRLYLGGVVVFTTASVACAMAPSILALNLARGVQGVGAAMLFGISLPIIAATFVEPRSRARAIAVYGAVLASAAAAGPLIGGIVVDTMGWKAIFLINVPIGILAFVAAWRYMAESRDLRPRRADWVGTATISIALFAGVFALIEGNNAGWTSATIIAAVITSLVALVVFVGWELRTPEPMLDLRLIAQPTFAALTLGGLAIGGTIFAGVNYLALYYMNTLQFSPLQAGLCALPLTLAAFFVSPVVAILQRRMPIRWSLPGAVVLIAAGLFLCTGVSVGTQWTHFVLGSIIGGVGLGAASVIVSQGALAFVSVERSGMATGTVLTARQVGTALGIAGLGALFADRATASTERSLTGLGPFVRGIPPHEVNRLTDALGSGVGRKVVDYLPDQMSGFAPAVDRIAIQASASGMDAIMWAGAITAGVLAVAIFVLCRLPGAREVDLDR